MTVAFAMVGCGGDDASTPPGTYNPPGPTGFLPPPAQAEDVVRFLYTNGSYLDIPFIAGETTWQDITGFNSMGSGNDGNFYHDDKSPTIDKTFAGWEDVDREVVFNRGDKGAGGSYDPNKIIQDPFTLTATWWSTVLTASASDDAEKVRLENGSVVIYEFDVGADFDLSTITGITVDYKVSEAVIGRKPETRYRLWGPYFFNGTTAVTPDATTFPNSVAGAQGKAFWGDFLVDDNGAFVARFEGSGPSASATAALTTFNKFHPYFMHNGPTTAAWNSSASNANTTITVTADDGAIAADTWYSVSHILDTTSAPGGYTLANALNQLTDSADAHLPVGTSKAKVYFGIGLTTYGGGSGTKWQPDPYNPDDGIIQLIKNVKLTTTTNGKESIAGARPTFTAGGNTSTQVFGGYVDPFTYCWRGPVSGTVGIVQDPNAVEPEPPQPPAEVDLLEYEGDELKAILSIFGVLGIDSSGQPTTTASEVDRAIISFDTDGITLKIDVTEFDFNTGQNKAGYIEDPDNAGTYITKTIDGVWDGGGISFTFPTNWSSYRSIKIDYTATIDTTTPAGDSALVTNDGTAIPLTRKDPQMSPRRGKNSFSQVLDTTNPVRYQNIVAGDNSFTITKAQFGPSTDFGTSGGTAVLPGISLVVNSWNGSNTPFNATFKVTKLSLIP